MASLVGARHAAPARQQKGRPQCFDIPAHTRTFAPCCPSSPCSSSASTSYGAPLPLLKPNNSLPRSCVACRAQPASATGLFPAGKQQAKVQLPALMLHVEAASMVEDAAFQEAIGKAVSSGVNSVVLWEGAGGAALLYDAALKLKELLRGRANLLLVDRTDIAIAAGAEGVLLTDQGVPTVVARRMLSGGPALVGRVVTTEEAAVTAAADGANLVLITGPDGGAPSADKLKAAKQQQRSGNPIPVIFSTVSGTPTASDVTGALTAGVDGIACMSTQLQAIAAACMGTAPAVDASTPAECAAAIVARLSGKQAYATSASASATTSTSPSSAGPAQPGSKASAKQQAAAAAAAAAAPAAGADVSGSSAMRRLRDPSRDALLQEEKRTLTAALAFLEEALPGLGEVNLLRDALKALDDLFLVVVVGEFNSGKSSLINALLGDKYLAEGILPTTNEISIIKYADPATSTSEQAKAGELVQQSDGLFVRYLPARLLADMNIVDTPGTNVILERQQRLTEEYVPRADLVLFIISADRPFSGSEVSFLEYIRQWRKKIVFVVNKADMLTEEEVGQVRGFVTANAQRTLGLDSPLVLAVSSRRALAAKLQASQASTAHQAGGVGSGVLDSTEDAALAGLPDWRASNFSEFESFICDFLTGRGPNGGEGVRLKLQTPLSVADALMGAAQQQLAADLAAARAELEGVRLVGKQLARFKAEMEKDASAQRDALLKLATEVIGRADSFVDDNINMSNAPLLLALAQGKETYPFRASFEAKVVGSAFDTMRAAVAEHTGWLRSNCDAQLAYYQAFAEARSSTLASTSGTNGSSSGSPGAAARLSAGAPAVTDAGEQSTSSSSGTSSSSSSSGSGGAAAALGEASAASALSEFNLRAISSLLDKELQQAMLGTAGTAVGAPLFGLFATQWMGNTLEDILLLGVAGLASYVALLNLPLRRADIKSKIARVAGNFVADVQGRMKKELEQEVATVVSQVGALLSPIEAAYAAEVDRLVAREAEQARLSKQLEELSRKIANLD